MSSGFHVSKDWMERNVLANPAVQSALDAKARRLAPIVQRIALKEGDTRYAESVRVECGRRPGTKSPTHLRRPYARVIIGDEHADVKEYGDGPIFPKRGFLRRAIAEEGG